jgi:hypothetical protein
MNAEKTSEAPLGGALLAAATSVVGLAFIGGCLYGLWMGRGPVHTPFGVRPNSGASIGDLLPVGFITALIASPAAFVLTLGAGFPLFHLWVRRGYSSIAVYVGGGIIVAMIAALIMVVAHTFAGFLLGNDFLFAMLLIAVSGPVAGFVVWCVLRRSIQERQPAIKS